MSFNKYLPSDHLMHHGVKGMKWGVRRFKNKDGTYTKEGNVKYNKKKTILKNWTQTLKW